MTDLSLSPAVREVETVVAKALFNGHPEDWGNPYAVLIRDKAVDQARAVIRALDALTAGELTRLVEGGGDEALARQREEIERLKENIAAANHELVKADLAVKNYGTISIECRQRTAAAESLLSEVGKVLEPIAAQVEDRVASRRDAESSAPFYLSDLEPLCALLSKLKEAGHHESDLREFTKQERRVLVGLSAGGHMYVSPSDYIPCEWLQAKGLVRMWTSAGGFHAADLTEEGRNLVEKGGHHG